MSHLQYAAILPLLDGQRTGAELRDNLKQRGAPMSRAAFYQLMTRVRSAGYVKGRHETSYVGEYTITESVYEISQLGRRAIDAVKWYYR